MKDQWKIGDGKFVALEEGRKQEERECAKKNEPGIHRCKQSMQYIKLILYVELILFMGWGCYMIWQIHRFNIRENEIIDIAHEGDSPIFESAATPSSEMPAIVVKPDVILDKLKRLMENLKLTKDRDLTQDNAAIDAHNIAYTQNPTGNANVQTDNIVKANDINISWLISLLSDLIHNKNVKNNSIPWQIQSIRHTDEMVTNEDNGDSDHNSKILWKLQDIAKLEAIGDLDKFENKHGITEDTNKLVLNIQEDRISDTSDKTENLGLDTVMISNLEDPDFIDRKITVSSLQDLKLSNTVEDAIQDYRSEESSLRDENGEPVDESLQPGFVTCFSSSQSYKLSDRSKQSTGDLSIPDSVFTQKILESIKNEEGRNSSDDIVTRNEDEHNIEHSDGSILTLISSNLPTSKSDELHSSFDKPMDIHSSEGQYLSEIIADIEDNENYKSKENVHINPFKHWSSQLGMQDSESEESSTLNDDSRDFDWINLPASFANDFQFKSGDTHQSSEKQNQLIWNKDIAFVEDLIPGSECQLEMKKNVLRVTCPTIKFDETWSILSSERQVTADYNDMSNDYYTDCDEDTVGSSEDELTSAKDTDIKEIEIIGKDLSKKIDEYEIHESLPDEKTTNGVYNMLRLPEMAKIDSFDSTEDKQANETKEEIRDSFEIRRLSNQESLGKLWNNFNYRKKRMIKDLLWSEEQMSNTLENTTIDVLYDTINRKQDKNVEDNPRRLFERMEILVACIDKLYELYLRSNKLGDDYASSEFPIEVEHRES